MIRLPRLPPAGEDGRGIRTEAGSPASVAIGVGFRKACTRETLVALVEEARARAVATLPVLATSAATLVTIAEKDRPVFREAAADLGLAVLILPKSALAGTEERLTLRSEAAQACLGIPSVAEAAALAAAGSGSRLVLARISVPEATCAIAIPAGAAAA